MADRYNLKKILGENGENIRFSVLKYETELSWADIDSGKIDVKPGVFWNNRFSDPLCLGTFRSVEEVSEFAAEYAPHLQDCGRYALLTEYIVERYEVDDDGEAVSDGYSWIGTYDFRLTENGDDIEVAEVPFSDLPELSAYDVTYREGDESGNIFTKVYNAADSREALEAFTADFTGTPSADLEICVYQVNPHDDSDFYEPLVSLTVSLDACGRIDTDRDKTLNTAISLGKRQLVDSIWKEANIEGLGTTFPATEKILDNLPVATRREEVLFIVNMKRAWEFLFDNIEHPENLMFLRELNKISMDGLIYDAGAIRTFPVTIGGTAWTPEIPFQADIEDNLKRISEIPGVIDRALEAFCYVARTQIFLDGNKRAAQLICNKILMKENVGILSVPIDEIDKFKELLVDFYETGDSSKLKYFLYLDCLLICDQKLLREQEKEKNLDSESPTERQKERLFGPGGRVERARAKADELNSSAREQKATDRDDPSL